MAVVLLIGVVVACTPNFVVMYALQFKKKLLRVKQVL